MNNLVSMDIFVDVILKNLKNEKTTKDAVLDQLDFYNNFIVSPLDIDMFFGDKQRFFGFDSTKSDDKIIFLTKHEGKQHMFTYNEKTKSFLGKKIINDLTNIGLTYK
jgi:hypothetical protein